ncbi:fatty acyl-CoA reductase wat [Leptinotarsa decemlineata]|uniref:fatty acyl-CoA reductase wat n=1 Tax=Leptinotarsa decemlineata TaxID=7539 RepID=UPI003D305850
MNQQENHSNYEREGNDITAADMVVPEQDSDLLNFYENSTIFITGATGFLGKLCMEKLLRTCSVRKIYILVRSKKGKDIEKRFEELFDEPSFDPLKRLKPDFRSKVEFIKGDACLPDLGISIEDQEKIISEVDCIFHYAATVRFDEKLRTATYINVRALRDLLRIAKHVKKLRAFVHVSTAFSNCINNHIDETFYTPPITGDKLIRLVECLDDNQLNSITPGLLGEYPNTYAFTKSTAEELLRSEGNNLPVVLFRPSIVTATYKEPISGWIDNVYGATGVLLGVAIGLLRVLRGDANNYADMVPADYVVNCSLATAWEVATLKSLNNNDEHSGQAKLEIPVFNYVSTPEKPLTWNEFRFYSRKHCLRIPSEKCIWFGYLFLITNMYLCLVMQMLLHTIPAYLVDFIAVCLRKEPKLVKGYEKIHKFSKVIEYFTLGNWKFENGNTQALWKKLKIQDKQLFDFSMKNLTWDSYFYVYTRGSRVYIVKDPLDTIPQGRKWYRKLWIMHYTSVAIVTLLSLKLVMFIFSNLGILSILY